MEIVKPTKFASMAIALCNANNAILLSDSRCVTAVEEGFLIEDHVNKLFKINSHLLLSVTGKFDAEEDFDAPFSDANRLSLDVDSAVQVVFEYLVGRKSLSNSLYERSYIIGGLDSDKRTAISYVYYNEQDDSISVEKICGEDGDSVLLYLPPVLATKYDSLNEELERVLHQENGEKVVDRVAQFVTGISKESNIINDEIKYLMVCTKEIH